MGKKKLTHKTEHINNHKRNLNESQINWRQTTNNTDELIKKNRILLHSLKTKILPNIRRRMIQNA